MLVKMAGHWGYEERESNVSRTTLVATMALAGLVLGTAAMAQPANDECTGAIAVFNGNNTVDNTGATQSLTLPASCLAYDSVNYVYPGAVFSGVDTWYSYTAAATAIMNFEIVNDANSPRTSTLAIYSACPSDGTLLACDTGGGVSWNGKIRHFAVTAGTTYIIRYSLYAAFVDVGPNVLNISVPSSSPVAFDDCELATPMVGEGLAPFDLATTTNGDVRKFDCDPFRRDGWFAWTPSVSGIGVVRGCSDTVPVNSGQLRLAAYPSCTEAPLVCMQNVNDPAYATACFPDISWNVNAGQTYLVRVAAQRMTTAISGSLRFEVRPPATGFVIPAGAISESEPCSNSWAGETNGGCAIVSHAVEAMELCNVYTGTTSARREEFPAALNSWLGVDNDVWEFTLTQDDTITITGQSEFFPRAALRTSCEPFVTLADCATNATAPTVGLTYNLGEKRVSGVVSTFTVPLIAGTYQYFISPIGSGNSFHDCSSGGNRYWFKITGSEPCQGACCTGTACTVGLSTACSGAYQGDGTACGPVGNPTTCCPANFDGANGLQVSDIFAYLNAWFASDPRSEFDGMGGLQVSDIFAFLNAWFAGC